MYFHFIFIMILKGNGEVLLSLFFRWENKGLMIWQSYISCVNALNSSAKFLCINLTVIISNKIKRKTMCLESRCLSIHLNGFSRHPLPCDCTRQDGTWPGWLHGKKPSSSWRQWDFTFTYSLSLKRVDLELRWFFRNLQILYSDWTEFYFSFMANILNLA